MTTLIPRSPYSTEELDSLYPRQLNLELVQIVSQISELHHSMTSRSSRTTFISFKEYQAKDLLSTLPTPILIPVAYLDPPTRRALANECSVSKCWSHTLLAILFRGQTPLVCYHDNRRLVHPPLATAARDFREERHVHPIQRSRQQSLTHLRARRDHRQRPRNDVSPRISPPKPLRLPASLPPP